MGAIGCNFYVLKAFLGNWLGTLGCRKQIIQSFNQSLRRFAHMHARTVCLNTAQEHVDRAAHVLGVVVVG